MAADPSTAAGMLTAGIHGVVDVFEVMRKAERQKGRNSTDREESGRTPKTTMVLLGGCLTASPLTRQRPR